MQITLTYNDLYAVVERSLSIIAKRSTDDQGNLLFDNITLGSREKDIITDYIKQAAVWIATETSAFVTASTENSLTLTFPINHNSNLDVFITNSAKHYCVAYALYSWFTVTAPRLAEKYLGDCTRDTAAIIRMTSDKQAPTGIGDILGTSTNVT